LPARAAPLAVAGRPTKPPVQEPVEEGPKSFTEWVIFIALLLVGWLGIALFIALCLAYGYVVMKIKEWFFSFF
jgi:hypothetical protein